MNIEYFSKIINENEPSKIDHINNDLVKAFTCRMQPNSLVVNSEYGIFSYIDAISEELVIMEIEAVNPVVLHP